MDYLAIHSLHKRLNYVKLVFLFLDVGASVLAKSLLYLYKGQTPPETHLVDLANSKSNNIYPVEKETLEKLKEGGLTVNQLDITLTYKLLQLSCGLVGRDSREGKLLWSKNCPKDKKDSFENLLFRYKEIRNRIIHDFKNLEELHNDAFDKIKGKSEALLKSIIIEVGIEVSLSDAEVRKWQQEINSKINVISLWDIQGSHSASTDDFNKQLVVLDFSDDDYDDGILNPKKKLPFKKKMKDMWSEEKEKDVIEREKRISEITDKSLKDKPVDIKRSRSRSKSIGLPLFQDKQTNVNGDLIKRDILARYGDELPNKGTYEDYLRNKKIGGPSPFPKSSITYWIDQLLTTNILDNDVTLQRFVGDYSKDQRETNKMPSIFRGITSRF